MKWTKHKVEIQDLDTFCDTYIKIVKKGEAVLEHLYCIFLYNDYDPICMYSIFDFLDLYQQKVITKDTIKKLITYQVLNS